MSSFQEVHPLPMQVTDSGNWEGQDQAATQMHPDITTSAPSPEQQKNSNQYGKNAVTSTY